MRWSVAAVGLLLLLGSGAYVVLDSEGPLVDTAEVVLPVLCGVAIVGYGYQLRSGDHTETHVATVALGQVLGALCFAALVGWIVVIQTLDGDVSPEPGYTLLNGVAIGAVVSGVVTAEYLLIRRKQRHVRRQNERLESFAGMISHDLRNPLNVATGRVELAREERESEHLDAAAAHERMAAMIDDLLTLAREGDEVSGTTSIDFAALVRTCWRNVDTAGAGLDVDAEKPVMVEADRERLQQLVENLVRNAVEHGGEGVTITVGRVEGGFYFEDDGPGIPAGERSAVFDPGYTTRPDGTGLGLHIIEQAAAAHGWTVRATAGDGGGARFEITGVTVGRG